MKKLLLGVILMLVAAGAQAQTDAELDAFIEMLRSDVRTEKIELIREYMDFTDEEAAAFWPIYTKYEREIRKINDKRLGLIRVYGEHYFDLKDDDARELMKSALELQIKRAHVRKDYFRKFEHALPTKTAVKFMQLEHQISVLVDLQISSELPFIE